MSTFPGLVKELPNISVDRFDDDNLQSSCYFLSHCHSDHMHGLSKLTALSPENKKYKLYCSSISRLILLNNSSFGFSEDQIVELNETMRITVPATLKFPSYEMTVISVPAGHCPGSIMFMFETAQERILYTGDFRIAKGDVKKFKSFHFNKTVKVIDKIYFDATFMSSKFGNFPSRSESNTALCKVIKEWLDEAPVNTVKLELSAIYGCEYLYLALANKLKLKICVGEYIYRLYWNVPEIGSCLTTDPNVSRIHVRPPNTRRKFQDYSPTVCCIKASAAWFKWCLGKPMPDICWRMSNLYYKVCYPTHCSYAELLHFLSYLKPKALFACTDVYGEQPNKVQKEMEKLLLSWQCEEYLASRREAVDECAVAVWPHTQQTALQIHAPAPVSSKEESSLLESPPRRKKRLLVR